MASNAGSQMSNPEKAPTTKGSSHLLFSSVSTLICQVKTNMQAKENAMLDYHHHLVLFPLRGIGP